MRAPLAENKAKLDDQELGRNMVDAIRAMMGLGPLYAPDGGQSFPRVYSLLSGGNLGSGCRQVRSSSV